jgi:hypothetical protein
VQELDALGARQDLEAVAVEDHRHEHPHGSRPAIGDNVPTVALARSPPDAVVPSYLAIPAGATAADGIPPTL